MKAILPLLFVVSAGVFALVLAGCSAALPARTQEKAADTTGVRPTTRPEIPLIDTQVPAEVETATFALG